MPRDFHWDDRSARRVVRSEAAKWVSAACLVVQGHAKKLLSVPGTGRIKGRKVKGSKATHSAPGEPPFKQTGRLRASVAIDVNDATLTGRVGTSVEYGRVLELGGAHVAPRPWLHRALTESIPTIQSLLARIKVR